MKASSLILLITLCSAFHSVGAQPVESVFLEAAYKKLLSSKAYTLAVAGLMPAADYSFRPSTAELAFGEQLLHLSKNLRWLSSQYLKDGQKDPMINSFDGIHKDSILKVLNRSYDYALKCMKDFPSQQLADSVEFFAGPMTKLQIINLINDHQTHHRGQLIVYLRVKGIAPPPYQGW